MSTVVVITPLVVANWTAISAAIIAVTGRKQFELAQARAREKVRADRLLSGKSVSGARQAASARQQEAKQQPTHLRAASAEPEDGRAEIDLAESEILPVAAGDAETLVIERGGVRATFSRDARGALKLCLEGPHLSKAELKAIGEDLLGGVTQQYAYHRIMSELKERQIAIVGEEVTPDQSVKIRVRNL